LIEQIESVKETVSDDDPLLEESVLKDLQSLIFSSNITLPDGLFKKLKRFNLTTQQPPANLPKASLPFSPAPIKNSRPEFNSNLYNFTIIIRTDPIMPMTEIGVVYVRDFDLSDSLTVNFTSEQELFAIIQNNKSHDTRYRMFQIFNLKTLDRDTAYPVAFGLNLTVTDSAGNTEKSHVNINVFKITEVADLPDIKWDTEEDEKFKNSNLSIIVDEKNENESLIKYKLKLDEESVEVNRVLHTLRAIKNESRTSSSPIKYRLVSENRLFRINETTGELFATRAFKEEPSLRNRRTVLFVQAFYDSHQGDKVPVWSHVAVVEIDLLRRKVPRFLEPIGNWTRTAVGRGGVLDNRVFIFKIDHQDSEADQFRFSLNASKVLVGDEFTIERDGQITNKVDSNLNELIK